MKALVCFAKSEAENLPVLVTVAGDRRAFLLYWSLPSEPDSENSQSHYSEPHFSTFRPQEGAGAGVSWAGREKA